MMGPNPSTDAVHATFDYALIAMVTLGSIHPANQACSVLSAFDAFVF